MEQLEQQQQQQQLRQGQPIDMTTAMSGKLLILFIKRLSLWWAWWYFEECVDNRISQ